MGQKGVTAFWRDDLPKITILFHLFFSVCQEYEQLFSNTLPQMTLRIPLN